METPSCPGCQKLSAVVTELLVQIAELQAKVRDLQARLGQNASNSSVPPSANPPAATKPLVKKPTGRRSGGQPAHSGTLALHSKSRTNTMLFQKHDTALVVIDPQNDVLSEKGVSWR